MKRSAGGDGLRERKRAALQATIERAALDLMLEHGYAEVTIDMICDASMISQRTFFNYFGSKEGVILGATPPSPSAEAIETFVKGSTPNILADFVAMITAVFVETRSDRELFTARRRLIQRTPELLDRQLTRISEAEDHLVGVVLARLRVQGRDGRGQQNFDDQAGMVVSMGMGVMRFVMRKRSSGEPAGSTQELIDHSIALIRHITDTAESN